MSQRGQMRFPAVSSPVSSGLSGMDRRQPTSRKGAEIGATGDPSAYSPAIHPQHSPSIVQTSTLPIVMSHEDTSDNMVHSLKPYAHSPEDDLFTNVVSPFYEDINGLLQQDWTAPAVEAINSAQMFTSGRAYEMYPEEVIADNESTVLEAPESEDASYLATSNTSSSKRRRDTPLTDEEKKERNRKYSKRYRLKQNQKTKDRDTELERANYAIRVLMSRLRISEAEIQRCGRRLYELEIENQSLRQQLIEPEGFSNACFFEKETGHGTLETRDSHMSDDQLTDVENSSVYPITRDHFQSPF